VVFGVGEWNLWPVSGDRERMPAVMRLPRTRERLSRQSGYVTVLSDRLAMERSGGLLKLDERQMLPAVEMRDHEPEFRAVLSSGLEARPGVLFPDE
jgi:hypothetical protein